MIISPRNFIANNQPFLNSDAHRSTMFLIDPSNQYEPPYKYTKQGQAYFLK